MTGISLGLAAAEPPLLLLLAALGLGDTAFAEPCGPCSVTITKRSLQLEAISRADLQKRTLIENTWRRQAPPADAETTQHV